MNKKPFSLIPILVVCVLIAGAVFFYVTREQWPVVIYKPEYAQIVQDSVANYKKNNFDYHKGYRDYDPLGYYVDKIDMSEFENQERIAFDEEGVPIVLYGDKYFYNPVTISQYSFARYAQYLDGDESAREKFLTAVDKLARRQLPDGSFRYEFEWSIFHASEPFPPGWVSAMAQGQTLSAFSRAYELTKDPRYLECGDKSLKFFLLSKDQGGTTTDLTDIDPSLSRYPFYEEYVSTPDNYTLNGYMFALLGLYDWSALTQRHEEVPKNSADQAFKAGVRTLEKLLPYYDLGGFTTYDLGHITFDDEPHVVVKYHMYHIMLLRQVRSVAPSDTLKHYEDLWISYIQ